MTTKAKAIGAFAAVAAVGFVVSLALLVWSERPMSALATFDVNPQFTVAVDSRSTIVEITPHDEAAQALFADTSFQGMTLEEAVPQIIEKLVNAGHLTAGSDLSIAVRPAPEAPPEHAAATADALENRLADTLKPERKVAVLVVILSAEDFDYLASSGLSPGDYVRFVADAKTVDAIRRLAELSQTATPDEGRANDTLDTLLDATEEMAEAGIGQADTILLLEALAAARFELDRASEFADTYSELTENGLTSAESLALIKSAIAAGLTMDAIWDIVDAQAELNDLGVAREESLTLIGGWIAAGWSSQAVSDHLDALDEQTRTPDDDDQPGRRPVDTPGRGPDPRVEKPPCTCDCDKPQTPETPSAPVAQDPAVLSAQEASAIALALVPSGVIFEIDRGEEAGRITWEVVIRNQDGTGTEIYVDAVTGEIIKQESIDPDSF